MSLTEMKLKTSESFVYEYDKEYTQIECEGGRYRLIA